MFHGQVRFDGASLARRPLVDHARAPASVPHVWPAETTVTRRDDGWLVLTDP